MSVTSGGESRLLMPPHRSDKHMTPSRWDFPMLAMSAARNGDTEKAIEWLLDPFFQFDDVGMPAGGAQVPTPYFPGSGGLLYAIAMMAGGWDGNTDSAPGFPKQGWEVKAENIAVAL